MWRAGTADYSRKSRRRFLSGYEMSLKFPHPKTSFESSGTSENLKKIHKSNSRFPFQWKSGEMVKCEVIDCRRILPEKKGFQGPISGCFISYKRLGWLKCHMSDLFQNIIGDFNIIHISFSLPIFLQNKFWHLTTILQNHNKTITIKLSFSVENLSLSHICSKVFT